MKIDILTLFPNMFEKVFEDSIIKRGIEDKKIKVEIHNFRDYSKDSHHKVDDTPYGGGAGMVLTLQPLVDCIKKLKQEDTIVILLTPSGKVYNQTFAYEL